jgi:hypothetical protein
MRAMPVSQTPRRKRRIQSRKHENIGSCTIISDANGEAVFNIDENGRISSPQAIDGTYTLRTTYPRDSGKEKVVFEHNSGEGGTFLTEIAQLCANFEWLAAIDTNIVKIGDEDIFISVFAITKNTLSRTEPDVEFETHAFYFFGVPEHVSKEMVGLDIALRNLVSHTVVKEPQRLGIVTDSDLGIHKQINARQLPYLGEKILDPLVKLIYASSDTGAHLTNDILRKCDSTAKSIAKYLVKNPSKIERTGASYKYCKDLARFDLSKLEKYN